MTSLLNGVSHAYFCQFSLALSIEMVFDPDSILFLIHLTKMRLFHGLEGRLIYQGAEASLQNDKPAAQHKAKLLQWQQRMRLPTGSDDDIK